MLSGSKNLEKGWYAVLFILSELKIHSQWKPTGWNFR